MVYKPKEFFERLKLKEKKLSISLKEFAEKVIKKEDSFFKKNFNVNGSTLEVYSYLNVPCEVFEQLEAHELRGLTFVESEGHITHFLSLHKFFNLNECESYKVENFKGLKIESVYEKLDGTLIQPVQIDGRIVLKTKAEIDSSLLRSATDLFYQRGLDTLVKYLWDKGYQPLFEFVSPRFQQVVKYDTHELYLIQVRNNLTGEYLPHNELEKLSKNFHVKIPRIFNWDLNTLIKRSRNLKNFEGWVLRFEGDIFVKLKTRWYLKHHADLSNFSEGKVLRYALRGKLDDLLPLLSPQSEKRKLAEKIGNAVRKYISQTVEKIIASEGGFDFIRKKCRGMKDEKLCIRRELIAYLLKKTSSGEGINEILREIKTLQD